MDSIDSDVDKVIYIKGEKQETGALCDRVLLCYGKKKMCYSY